VTSGSGWDFSAASPVSVAPLGYTRIGAHADSSMLATTIVTARVSDRIRAVPLMRPNDQVNRRAATDACEVEATNWCVRLNAWLGPAFGNGSDVLFGKTKVGQNLLKPRRILSVPFVRLRGITKVVAQSRRNGAIERPRQYSLCAVRF